MRALLLLVAWCVAARGDDLIPRIRARMAPVLLRQPDYTCLETIERTRQAVGGKARVEDTLRLEVALVDGKEMFAWPGSKQFEDRELRDLVTTGMFGNGNFAIYARVILLTDFPTFEYRGETLLHGRTALRHDFRVSRSSSPHWLRVNDRQAAVGFHGSLYTDPDTLDLRRIEVTADDIPADLGLSAAEVQVDYGWSRIGEESFLLPVESELMMAVPDVVNRNWVRFSSCRRFAGESTLLFTDPVLSETAVQISPREIELPAGLELQLELQDVDLSQAAVGDEVQAVLRADLKNRRQLLAPKGALARGRIVRLDRYRNYFTLKIDFKDLEWPGGHARLKLSFDRTAMPTRSVTRAEPGGEIVITREASSRLRGILMYWRTEP